MNLRQQIQELRDDSSLLTSAEIQDRLKQILSSNAFEEGTMNRAIFTETAPYDNPYQGLAEKHLWACSAGLLRSPTGASISIKRGFNARACGTSLAYALIPMSANLIAWADKIIFVNPENFEEALSAFSSTRSSRLTDQIKTKAIILDIPDRYPAFSEKLEALIEEAFDKVILA